MIVLPKSFTERAETIPPMFAINPGGNAFIVKKGNSCKRNH